MSRAVFHAEASEHVMSRRGVLPDPREWIEHDQYPGYLVHSDGYIYSIAQGEIIGNRDKRGPYVCLLYLGGKHVKRNLHRLVWEYNTGCVLEPMEVITFEDGDLDNCSFENLVYFESRKQFYAWRKDWASQEKE